MLSLSSTLLAAQQEASGLPYIRAVLADYDGNVSRLRFNRYYSGSEADGFSAIVTAGDGSIVRARIDAGTHVLYLQRVATPGPASTYSSWTSLGTVSVAGAVALAASDANVWLFYVDPDTVTLKLKASSDYGATFGSAATVATAATAVSYIAAAFAPGGDCVLFWTVGAAVWKSRNSGGAWGTAAAWSDSAASLSGIACLYRVDWDLVVCGTEAATGDAKVWTLIYGDGGFQGANTWSALREVTTATAASNVSFRAPALEFSAHWRLYFVEKYTGSLAYSRLQVSAMNANLDFTGTLWQEPAAFDYAGSDFGVAATTTAGYLWLSAAAGVWAAASPSWASLDVSDDVVAAEVQIGETDGRARLAMRNDPASGVAGRFSAYGSGDLVALQRGARVQLAPGYYTSAGAEAASEPAYWVEAIEQTTGPRPTLILHLRDAWWLLERWRARRQFVWDAGTKSVAQLLEYVCARAGLDYAVLSSSSALGLLKPAFTISAGESARTAIERLLAFVPDNAIARGSTLYVRYPQAGDTTDAAFGTSHAIRSARYVEQDASVNRVRVLGSGVFNEAFDLDESSTVGERIGSVADLNLTTTAQAGDRAASDLRDAQVRGRQDEIDVFGVHCGVEVYDVVAVTDAQAGLSAEARRVLGLRWRYAPEATPPFAMTLSLGNP